MNWTTSTDKLQTMLNIEMSWKDTNRRWLSVFHGINCIFEFISMYLSVFLLLLFLSFMILFYFSSSFGLLLLRNNLFILIFRLIWSLCFFLDTVWSDFMNFDTQSHIIDESFNLNRTKNDNYYYSPWKLSTNNHFKLI